MNDEKAKKLLEKVKNDYDAISDEFDITRKREWKEFEIFLADIKDGQHIADIGCGNGRFLEFLNKHKKIEYIGIDNSKNLIKKAKETYGDHFKEGDMLEIPLANESQDVVVAIASFHHLPNEKLRKKTLKEFARILKPKGTLLLTAWNLYQGKYDKYFEKDSQDTYIPWGKSGINRYYYAFKPAELKSLLSDLFEIKQYHKGNNLVFICKKK